MRLLISITLVLASAASWAQVPAPGKADYGRMLIRYGIVHVGDGSVIENAYVEVQNGEFSRVSDANTSRINESDFDTIIDAEGKQIFPGFMVMDSRLGLTEIGAVRATHDYNEVGKIIPNVRALPAFNTESKIIPTVRRNGVLMAQIAPVGGRVSGASSVVHFDGWEWQDATVRADEGVYLNWPKRYAHTGWWADPGPTKDNKKYEEQVTEIKYYFDEAIAYQALEDKDPINLRFEAMEGVLSGESRLYIRADWTRDILDAIQFVRRYKIERVAIVGGAEADLVSTELRENNIAVIIDRVHKMPAHPDAPIDAPYRLASRLVEGGVDVCFAASGSMEAMISRNLPFQVGTAVHYGLPYEQAIRSLSLVPAQMAGIDDRYGSISPGKVATFFISEGDPLDITSNRITSAFIEGRIVRLEDHQEDLYLKYSKKHGVAP